MPRVRNMTPVELKMAQAVTVLVCSHPFFATLLLKLTRVEDPTAPTMWTDGRHIGYNPTFVEKLSRDELMGVLAHEVLHVANLHHLRRGTRNPRAWNVATDAAINHIVKEAGMSLPAGCIPPIANKSSEEIYVDLPEMPDGNADPGGTGEIRDLKNGDGTALSDAQREQAVSETKVAVQQAANAAKRAGKLPAGLKRFIDDVLEPKVPWKEILSRFIDGSSRHDYSWARPNKRYIDLGMILPSLWSPGYGQVMLGCDTSGSIDQGQLKDICGEVLGCLEMYAERGQPAQLTVAWFDHAVYPQTVECADDLQPRGGGGTSFRVVMEYLAESGEYPKALIMVTDGCCSDFGNAPPMPVLWVLTHRNPSFTPPFGEIACTLYE